MKRIIAFLLIAVACAAVGWRAFEVAAPPTEPLSKFVPAGPMLYLEARDFSTLLGDWNRSPEKQAWLASTSYEVFSRSRLFLRLRGASDQFAVAAGLPPDMKILTEVAGDRSALALYDIGKLQFLYITHLPSAKAMQTSLWQTRAKFEPRTVGSNTFFIRRDPESEREVAFAVSGDYLLLATREDLLAGALQLMNGAQNRTVESEFWWTQATTSAPQVGDLRMVLNLSKIVPDGYFRTYWLQQNITDLSQYSAAVSDLFRGANEFREERVLVRKAEANSFPSPDDQAAASEVARLVPSDFGTYQSIASPSGDSCFELLRSKLLDPHLSAAPPSESAPPQVQLTSGEVGGPDLETRIDQPPVQHAAEDKKSALESLLQENKLRAALFVQSTARDNGSVFVRFHSAVVLVSDSAWNESELDSALAAYVRPNITASELGVSWQNGSAYHQFDGLWPLVTAIRGNYWFVSDDPEMLATMLAKFEIKPDRHPGVFIGEFSHQRERANFARFSQIVDRPSATANAESSEPQFFSGTIASLSSSLLSAANESITVRVDKDNVRQTVTYRWSH